MLTEYVSILRGLTTFTQVWYTFGEFTYTVEAPFAIEDSPYYVSGSRDHVRSI